MNFGDSLKMNERTPQEYYNEQKRKQREESFRKVQETLSDIKRDLDYLVRQGRYIVNSKGEKELTSISYCPQEFLSERRVDKFQDMLEYSRRYSIGMSVKQKRMLYGSFGSQISAINKDKESYSITFSVNDDFSKFYEKLCKIAKKDGISITYGLLEKKTKIVYDLPKVFYEPIRSLDYRLALKCTSIIPEKYTSDKPISLIIEGSDSTISTNTTVQSENSERIVNFDSMNGYEFENFCAEILKKNGFERVCVTSGSGDQGIDIIAERDGIKYGIQCKCYNSDVGNGAVQEAYAGIKYHECHVGIVLTNRYFTRSARELAEKNGIVLWNRDKLIELINPVKKRRRRRQTYYLMEYED